VEPANRPRLVVNDSKLYALWDEDNPSGIPHIRARVYNGNDTAPLWGFVDGNGSAGLNFGISSATEVDAISFNNVLYAAWKEAPTGVNNIRVSAYNGNDSGPSWSFVDGAISSGLNQDPNHVAATPSFAVNQSKLYLAWTEFTSGLVPNVRVKKYDSPGFWTFVDGGGANGLNYNPSNAANAPTLISFNGKLYLFWSEVSGANGYIRGKVYNGNDTSPAWADVGTGAAYGLNFGTMTPYSAEVPRAVVFSGKLYLTWREPAPSFVNQVRVRVYNGNDSSPLWAFVDGNGAAGLNHASTDHVETPLLIPFGTSLFASWIETYTTARQLRMKLYNGNDSVPGWQFADGGTNFGLNRTGTYDATNPNGAILNSKLYVIWSETDAATPRIRVSVGQ